MNPSENKKLNESPRVTAAWGPRQQLAAAVFTLGLPESHRGKAIRQIREIVERFHQEYGGE